MAVHDFDMARFLVGSEVTEVYCKGSCKVRSKRDQNKGLHTKNALEKKLDTNRPTTIGIQGGGSGKTAAQKISAFCFSYSRSGYSGVFFFSYQVCEKTHTEQVFFVVVFADTRICMCSVRLRFSLVRGTSYHVDIHISFHLLSCCCCCCC